MTSKFSSGTDSGLVLQPAQSGTVLIVPGFRGSGPTHWQTWLEERVPGARRVSGIDWDAPALGVWAARVRAEIVEAPGPVWLVAHSFGCLAAALGGSDRAGLVAGALLVAPADPERFSPAGLRVSSTGRPEVSPSLTPYIPKAPLGFPCMLVASRDDPWMPISKLRYLASRWDAELVDVGNAGHINVDSGFGPWPQGLELLHRLQKAGQALAQPELPSVIALGRRR
jgi:uncharacterized protein